MKKRIFKILLVFILLFSVGITSVHAATFRLEPVKIKDLKEKGLITHDWYSDGRSDHIFCAGPIVTSEHSGCKEMYDHWNLYAAQDDIKYYILYCLNLSLDWDRDGQMTQYDGLDSIDFHLSSLSQDEKNARIDLLKRLLLYGYNPDPSNNTSLSQLIANDREAPIKLIAMQVLIWEVMEGSRTSLHEVAPNLWNDTNSFYNQVIYPNGGDNPSATGTLYYYYRKYIDDARLGEAANAAPAFDTGHYTLIWDSSKNKYQKTISGIGDYKTCESNDVSVSVSGDSVIVSSNKEVKNATVTCKYYRGTGASNQSKEEEFKFFRFNNNPSSKQDMIFGSGWKIYQKSFKVSSESEKIKIKKVDTENANVDDAEFTLTHSKNKTYVKTIKGNKAAVELIYSGQYIVSESVVPSGYEKLKDFNITIDGETHKATCTNNQVKISYESDGTIVLTITNVAKNFKLLKVDKSGKAVNGAKFEIRDKKNNVMKFSLVSGNIYKYDTKGTITQLFGSSTSSYPISLLPEGEYKVVEISVPYPYKLPSKESEKTTWIKMDSKGNVSVYSNKQKTYVPQGDATVRIVNYTTQFIVHKVGHSNPLEGVQFELYNSDKTEKIKSYMTSAGVYSIAENQNTAENYVYITNSAGNVIINNIPEGTYWLKEVYTIPPYVLPSGDGVYTKVVVGITQDGVTINNSYNQKTIEISNTPNSFNFYKRDTEGNALTTGKYKLQKYDKESNKYVDLKLVEVENDGTYNPNTVIYKVDDKKGKIQFTLTKGVATFIDMESSSTYRIIETVAPTGYTKASTKDTATVQIDEYGNASGMLVLVDQKIVKEDDSAYAELIINIQTGKQRIMYAAIITLVIAIIAGLIIYSKRK